MRDLSLHILDLAENSIRAGADLVEIGLALGADRKLTLTIRDNGCGMSEEMVNAVMSPFTTSRTTRKVGLGIPLMTQNARLAGGDVCVTSRVGEGTELKAWMFTDQIDCLPLGDVPGTLVSLICSNPLKPDFRLTCSSPEGEMVFDTREVRQALGEEISLSEPEIASWMRESMQEDIQPIFGGVIL